MHNLVDIFYTCYDTFWSDIISGVIATIFGGIILAFIFFFTKEKIFPIPRLVGRWFFQIKTLKTSYNPYKNMELQYEAFIWCEGNKIYGTSEKTHENSSTQNKEFIGTNRRRGNISGYIEKNYFGKDKIYIHIVEDGNGRKSTNFYELEKDSGGLSGTFVSMVANQSGTCRWQRERF